MIKHPYPDDDRKKFLSSFVNIKQEKQTNPI